MRNVLRISTPILLALFLLLTTLGLVRGQGVAVTISPPQPMAGQTITFYWQAIPLSQNYMDIIPASAGCGIATGDKGRIQRIGPVTSDQNGEFTITLSAGLPEGSYFAGLISYRGSSFSNFCFAFTATSPAPVPEFLSPLALLFLIFTASEIVFQSRIVKRER